MVKVIVSNLLDSKSCFLPPFCEEGGRVKKNETQPFIKFPKIETLVVTGDIWCFWFGSHSRSYKIP